MSWFFSFPATGTDFPQTSVHAIDAWKESGGAGDPDAVAQAEAAIEAANALISSGAVHYLAGEGTYTVNLSGHANPEHKPREGYTADQITVTVIQAGG